MGGTKQEDLGNDWKEEKEGENQLNNCNLKILGLFQIRKGKGQMDFNT